MTLSRRAYDEDHMGPHWHKYRYCWTETLCPIHHPPYGFGWCYHGIINGVWWAIPLLLFSNRYRSAEYYCARCLQPSITMDWDDTSSIFRRPRGFMLSSSISWGKPSVWPRTVQIYRYQQASEPCLLTLYLLGIMGPAFGRMASCLLMLKLFGTNNVRRRLLWFIFWESLVVNAITLILVYAQCKDVQSLWDPVGHPSACWSPKIQEVSFYDVRRRWPRWSMYSILDSFKEAGFLEMQYWDNTNHFYSFEFGHWPCTDNSPGNDFLDTSNQYEDEARVGISPWSQYIVS